MELTGDELAGVVDLFGSLTREELRRGCSELAFKRGVDLSAEAADAAIDDAVGSYVLLPMADSSSDDAKSGDTEDTAPNATADREGPTPVNPDDGQRLVVGPAAFPTLPAGAEDLPHIMDVEERTPDSDRLARIARRRFEADADAAIGADDRDRIAELLEVGYELDVWGPVDVDVGSTRAKLADAE